MASADNRQHDLVVEAMVGWEHFQVLHVNNMLNMLH